MQIGVHTPPLYDRSIEAAIEYVSDLGVRAIEPEVGGHPGTEHLPPDDYLDRERRQTDLKQFWTNTR